MTDEQTRAVRSMGEDVAEWMCSLICRIWCN